jgi:hypothetical protein
MLGLTNAVILRRQRGALTYQIKEFLAGRVTAEYSSAEPTALSAAQMATGRMVTCHKSGNFFLEVTDMASGRMFAFQYANCSTNHGGSGLGSALLTSKYAGRFAAYS